MFRLRDLLLSSGSLMMSQLLTAFVGFVFWFIAARSFTQSEVGFASAVISALSLVGAIGMMGLGTLLIHEIPRHPGREMGMIGSSILASAVIGGLLGLGFVAIGPSLSVDFRPLQATLAMVVAVVAGAGLTSASLVVDQAVIGMMRSRLQLVRNVVAALSRLALLAAAAVAGLAAGDLAVVAVWTASVAISMAALAGYAAWRRSLPRVIPLRWDFLGESRTAALKHHVLNLAIQVPGWAMPLIAVTVLSARTNGGFYFAWLLVGLASFVVVALTWVLFAAASRDPASLAQWGWVTLRLSALAAFLSAIGLWVLGPFVLEIFGRGYADVARSALLVLPLTLFPTVIKGHYVTIHRARGTVLSAAVLIAAGAVLEMVGAYIGASLAGLSGLGLGLVAAMVCETLPMTPTVYRAIVRPHLSGRSTLPKETAP